MSAPQFADRVVAYIGVGANLGFAQDAVMNALVDLSGLPDSEFIAASGLYRSAAMGADGPADGPDYINAAAEIATRLAPHDLLAALQAIELRHGRVRTTRNAPRTLDLDLLLYGDTIIVTPDLVVPHPRLAERAFVLRPLLELAPDLRVPGKGPARGLLADVADQRVEALAP